ncbi:MAG TPA: hypothetical protein VJW96_10655 [Terriglobales bacterium]|nr:hypothetical protein [Terriglobales bacterium]
MLEQVPGTKAVTVGGDKGFDTRDFVKECRQMGVTPHVTQNHARPGGSALDGHTTRHPGYAISQRKRKRIEECFGWLKTIRAAAESTASRSVQSALDFYPRLRRLQSGAHTQPDPRSSGGVTQGRRVSSGASS